METGRRVNIEADAAYHEKTSVTLERMSRLEELMVSEIEEIKKLLK